MCNLRDEGEVSYSALSANEPLLLLQNTVQDAKDTLDLILVALNCAWNLLGVVPGEPRSLTVVRTLSRGLEEEPLELVELVGLGGSRDSVLGVILVSKVYDDRVGFPGEKLI